LTALIFALGVVAPLLSRQTIHSRTDAARAATEILCQMAQRLVKRDTWVVSCWRFQPKAA
jgi:hypothetical protein